MFSRFRKYFITGVAIIFPMAITVIIVRFLVIKINSYILNPLVAMLRINPFLTEYSLVIAKWIVFFLVVSCISLIGWAANILFLRKTFGFGERIFLKVPMIGKIYSVTKEIGYAFLGRGKAFFKKVVLIEYPRKGIYSIGFLTAEESAKAIRDISGKDLLSIFVATTPNPTSGFFLLMPKEDTKILDMTVEEGMKLVVSSGAIIPINLGYKK